MELRLGKNAGIIKIYPNPTSSNFYFILENRIEDFGGLYDVEIININGNSLFKNQVIEGEKINIEFLPNGLYKVIIKKDSQVIGVNSLVKIK